LAANLYREVGCSDHSTSLSFYGNKEGDVDGGYITLHRKIRDWQWYHVDYMYKFFTELLFLANLKDKKWKTIIIPRGSFITSIHHLSEYTGLTVRQVRTGVARLQSTGELTIKTTNKYTMITITNYNTYQLMPNYYDKQDDKQMTNERQQLNKGNNIGIKKNTINTNYVASEDEIYLCDLLKSKILENNPKARVNNGMGWYRECSIMLINEQRTKEDIESVIIWCQQDNFWKSNILSMKKLREKFDQLYLRMGGGISKGKYSSRCYNVESAIKNKPKKEEKDELHN
jgi:hypothetical protein